MKNIASHNKFDHAGLISIDKSVHKYDNRVTNVTINIINNADGKAIKSYTMTEEQYKKCGFSEEGKVIELLNKFLNSESNKGKSPEERVQELLKVISNAVDKEKNIVKALETRLQGAVEKANKKQSMWGGAIAALLGAAVCCLFGTLINNSVVSGDAKICFIFAWVFLGIGVICAIGLLYAYIKAAPGENWKEKRKVFFLRRKLGKIISIIIVCLIVVGIIVCSGIGYHNVPYNCDLNGHIDSDGDFYCDECKAVVEPNCEPGKHIDKNDNGVCDFCDAIGHQERSDGKCDHCDECMDHRDVNVDGVCDNCGACLEHMDENGDWLCDRCGAEMESVVDSNGFKYTLEDGTLAVSAGEGFKGGALVIPSTYQGMQVTAISDNGFNNQTMVELLTSITIPEGIKKIGNNAFAGSGLTKVTIPSTVEVIGEYAFAQSGKLEQVTVNGAATTLGDHCFAECGALTTISLGANVSALGSELFSGCSALKTVNYGGTLEQWSLLSKADNWDADTQTIDILCSDAGTDKNEQYAYVLLEDDTYSVQAGLNFSQVAVTILEEFNGKVVTSIAENAFANEVGIESVQIPDSINFIQSKAFYNCLQISKLDMGSGIAFIGNMSFAKCTKISNLILPNSLEYIGDRAFENCNLVEELTIPNSVLLMGDAPLSQMLSLTSIVIPYIGLSADNSDNTSVNELFGGDVPASLANLTIKNGYSITDKSFTGCNSISKISLENINMIKKDAFKECINLTELELPEHEIIIENGAFDNCDTIEMVSAYSTNLDSLPHTLKTLIVNGGQKLETNALQDMQNLACLILSGDIIEIGNNLFAGLDNLIEVIFQGDMYQWDLTIKNSMGNEQIEVECNDGVYRTYYVNYELNGGINSDANPVLYYSVVDLGGENGSFVLANPTKLDDDILDYALNDDGLFDVGVNSYEFKGWYTDSMFTNKVTALSNALKDITLYALWEEVPKRIIDTRQYVRVNKDNNLDSEGDYILFGSYPQTVKQNNISLEVLEDDGFWRGSDGERYLESVAYPVRLASNLPWPTFSDGSAIDEGEKYYFKVEPIKWRILTIENGSALILANSILTKHKFDDSNKTYKESEIRNWLNTDFLQSAFTEKTQMSIVPSKITDIDSNIDNEVIVDKIFLLDEAEATNTTWGFEGYNSYYDEAKQLVGTDYAVSSGLGVDTLDEVNFFYKGCAAWWLRNMSNYGQSIVRSGGWIRDTVPYVELGVVPALTLKL